jgi:hypothetical protein
MSDDALPVVMHMCRRSSVLGVAERKKPLVQRAQLLYH